MKLGIVGKGGVGKTTVAALLAQGFAARGRRVLAVDTDSNPNLALNLGLDPAAADEVPLLPRALAVGAGGRPGETTPAELVAQYGRSTPAGVTLMHAMRVEQAGAGCTCASHATVRSLLAATIEEEADVTIVDMEAGLEHLSRSGGTLAAADVLCVVMDASRKSALTASRTLRLAAELGLRQCLGVANKVEPEDRQFFGDLAAEFGIELVALLPRADAVDRADREGQLLDPSAAPELRAAVDELIDELERRTAPA